MKTLLTSKPVILANWKMHFTESEIHQYYDRFLAKATFIETVTIGFAVPSPFMRLASKLLEKTPYITGAQNVHWELKGAFTGEISPGMIIDSGASFVLIGHSERRTHFGDTNQTVSKRTKTAVTSQLTAIVCVGETREEYEAGLRDAVLRSQIPSSLSLLEGSDFSKLVIAYEPVWAIGTGLTATPDEAESAHSSIREILTEMVSSAGYSIYPEDIPIIYGGSVKGDNAEELIIQKNIDGFLVGGASLDPNSFLEICSCIN